MQLSQSELQWTASDDFSTSNSNGKHDVVIEEAPQSVVPIPPQLHPQMPPTRGALSHSSSAPDLRLLLTTELPDAKPMFLPIPGSYAGAMVPYKSPEVRQDTQPHFFVIGV